MFRSTLVILAVSVLCVTAHADVPTSITVQGKLTDAAGVPYPPGQKAFTFRIFDSEVGGTEWWPGGTGEFQAIETSPSGLWIAQVGDSIPLVEAVFSGASRWLQISVDGTPLPRVPLTTDPYAFRIETVNGAYGGNIKSRVSIGTGNTLTGLDAFTAGGSNIASGDYSIVLGRNHFVDGEYATVGGGYANVASGSGTVVAGGRSNSAPGDDAVVSGGTNNEAWGYRSVVGGGAYNEARGSFSVVVGGGGFSLADSNAARAPFSVVVGGTQNIAEGEYSFIGGGGYNVTQPSAQGGTIGGGVANGAIGISSTVSGGNSGGSIGDYSAVGGGQHNLAIGEGSVIAGGGYNYAHGLYSTVGGGGGATSDDSNSAGGNYATVSGGIDNSASGQYSTVGGGSSNIASQDYSTIGGGLNNRASGSVATVAGGSSNQATGSGAVVSGGVFNSASGWRSVVLGGQDNVAQGRFSLAAGRNAAAFDHGSFVWADTHTTSFPSTGPNQFLIRANGGVGIGTNAPQQQLSVLTGMNIDQANANNGNVANTLTFGSASGEAIGSRRAPGSNQYGLDFYTGAIIRMSIANFSGYVGFGLTNPAYRIELPNILNTDGIGRAAAWVTYSSRRWKENIKTIDHALEKVERLRGVEYDTKSGGHHSIGLIAEEVGEVIPDIVQYESNGKDAMSLDYARLTALLIEAVKEQQKQIDELKQTIDSMRP